MVQKIFTFRGSIILECPNASYLSRPSMGEMSLGQYVKVAVLLAGIARQRVLLDCASFRVYIKLTAVYMVCMLSMITHCCSRDAYDWRITSLGPSIA